MLAAMCGIFLLERTVSELEWALSLRPEVLQARLQALLRVALDPPHRRQDLARSQALPLVHLSRRKVANPKRPDPSMR